MMSEGGNRMVTGAELKQLAAQKEGEWRDVQELRAQSLEAALKESEKSLEEYKAKFEKLKEDFKYNLKLLKERDAELSKYDTQSVVGKRDLATKDAEISELKIQLDQLQGSVEREKKSREEMQQHYQHRVREKQAQLDQYKAAKDAESNQERFSLENTKRELERKLVQQEEEMDAQRRELTSGFEEESRKREHEYRKKIDECNATVLAHEMKVKLLSKELELMKAAQNSVDEGFTERDEALKELDKRLKQKEWEVQDFKAVHEAKSRELELKLQQAEHAAKRAQEDYNRKHAELNRYMNEKETALTKLKTASAERERQLEETTRHVTSQLETKETEFRQLEWQKQDMEREKDSQIERLSDELEEVKSRQEAHASDLHRENVTRDLELEKLRESESKLKTDLIQRKQDIERYKKEVQQALEREASLERSKAQLQLDWQRRYEDTERQQYEKSEDLVRHLTQARDEAQALLKEKLRELKHKADMVTVLAEDRDRALATLKQFGLTMQKDIDLSQFRDLPVSAAKQLEELQQQNENLRHVVHQMRAEMEELGKEVNEGEKGPATKKMEADGIKHSVASDYVRNLEKEIKNLKRKCRDLEQRAADAVTCDLEHDNARVTEAVGDNMLVQSHIERLNSEIGKLRSDKVEVTAQCRKQQARLQYLQNHLEQLSKQPREKQVELEQLQYEMAAESRRTQAQLASQTNRIRELEVQLLETRKEADEYMKANIEANNQLTSLGQQLSLLKVNVAQATPTVNFGAQEILIQQLQDEISQLRDQLKSSGKSLDPVGRVPAPGSEVKFIQELHSKLRQAAKQITQLAKEKQQLIEMGNRLRAELNKHKLPIPTGSSKIAFQHTTTDYTSTSHIPPPTSHMAPPTAHTADPPTSTIHTKIQNKLSQLEQLQYELTKQELSYRQKFGSMQASSTHVPHINVDSSLDTSEVDTPPENLPKSILRKSVDFIEKLSPLPENDVHVPRPKSTPTNQNGRMVNGRPGNMSDRQVHSARSDPYSQRSSSPIKDHPSMRISMSSVGGESLQEIWNILDQDGSYTARTPYDSQDGPFPGLSFPGDVSTSSFKPDTSNRPKSAPNPLTVQGNKNPLKPKPSKEPSKKLTPRMAGKPGANKRTQAKPHVRNWNVKDDPKTK